MKEKKNKGSISLTDFMGEGVQVKESQKSINKKDKAFFVNLINILMELEQRTEGLLEFGVDLILYEEPLHLIIESLIYKNYGHIKGELIYWWVSEKLKNSGKNLTLKGTDGEEYSINTPLQLYMALQKIGK